jgi:hypothetical protein
MARVTLPLISGSASGKVGNDVVYSHWKKTPYVRIYVAHNTSKTTAQITVRTYFSSAVSAWQAETSTVKGLWNTYVKGKSLNMSGFNFYVKKYVDFLEAHSGTPPTVTNTPPSMS